MAQYAGRNAQVKLSGSGVGTTGEATTDVGGTHLVYQITNAAHQILDPTAAVTVKKNGTAVTSGFTVDRLYGRVTFASALLGTDVVTVDATYLPMAVVAACHDFDYTISGQTIDATTFDSAGWTEREQGLGDVQGTVGRFYQVDNLFIDALQAGTSVVLELRESSAVAGARIRCLFSKSEVKGAVASLVDETLTFEGSADADGRAASFA